ncbi:MAG: hypothetical protein ACOC9Y_03140, partial [Chloroflexota bacterium]
MANAGPSSVEKVTSAPSRNSARIRLRHERRPRVFSVIVTVTLVIVDAVMIALAFWLGYQIPINPGLFDVGAATNVSDHQLIAVLVILISIVWFALSGLYGARRGVSRLDDSAKMSVRVIMAVGLS